MSDHEQLTAIKKDLKKWQQYCAVWADAYRGGAQNALLWNSWLVAIGVALAARTTLLSAIGGAGGTSTVQRLAIAGAVVGALTTAVNGFQKLAFASPEQIKQCHSAAAGYEGTKRDLDSALTNVDLGELKKQRDTIQQRLSATDSQAPELRAKFSTQAKQALSRNAAKTEESP